MIRTPSPIPLYHQVFGILRQRVVDGSYPEGAQLAAEDELAAEFEVSRATIRQAVGELVKVGLVSRKQGRGTFVLATEGHSLGQSFSGSLADLIAETKRTQVRTVELEREARIPSHIADQLKLDDSAGTIVRRERTMDGEPFAFTINYLPPQYGDMVDEQQLKGQGLMTLLESKGVKFTGGTQSIRAQLADIDIAAHLGLGFGAPVLFVERLLLGPKSGPLEVVRSWYRGDQYTYSVSFGAQRVRGDLQAQFA